MSRTASKIDLSIIVPTYNEEEGIKPTIKRIYKDANKASIKKLISTFEVVVVDDGSSDGTGKILSNLEKLYKNLEIVKHHTNKGLGSSIITGVKNSNKKFITYLPADGQVFLNEITEGLRMAPNADLVLTYRGKREGYNPYRHLLSNSLMIFMKVFFGLNFKDYNWVHIYKRSLFKSIKTKSKGVFYLAEIVARANQKGYRILEAQAKYHPRSTGYAKNARLSIVIRTLIDLFQLWTEIKIKPILK